MDSPQTGNILEATSANPIDGSQSQRLFLHKTTAKKNSCCWSIQQIHQTEWRFIASGPKQNKSILLFFSHEDAHLGRSFHSMWRIDGFSPQDLQMMVGYFMIFHGFSLTKSSSIHPRSCSPCLLIKNRRSIPAAETGRDFGLRRLRNLNSKISPKGRKAGVAKQPWGMRHFSTQTTRRNLYTSRPSMHDDHYSHQYQLQFRLRKIPVCSLGWIEKTRILWREATRFIQRLVFQSPIARVVSRTRGMTSFKRSFCESRKPTIQQFLLKPALSYWNPLKEVHPLIFIIWCEW